MTSTATAEESPIPAPASVDAEAIQKVSSVPAIVVSEEQSTRPATSPGLASQNQLAKLRLHDDEAVGEHEGQDTLGEFHGITTDIPTGSFDDLFSASNLEFSKRGSVLLGGKRANGTIKSSPSFRSLQQSQSGHALRAQPRLRPARSAIPGTRLLSADEEMLSKRVRSMYEYGTEGAGEVPGGFASQAGSILEEALVEEEDEGTEGEQSVSSPPASPELNVPKRPHEIARSPSFNRRRQSSIKREPTETAGGMEDWQDVENGEVDRYGFILPKKIASRGSSAHSNLDGQLHRVTTSLQLASEGPRRKRTVRRAPSNARSARSGATAGAASTPKRRISKRSPAKTGSIYSNRSTSTAGTSTISPFRYASNRLPHNRERRWMDEASDMLTLPPGLADIAEQQDDGKAALAMKRKEWEREEKWRKMGKVTKKDAKGGGMVFAFDTRDSKLISRTWKGIPDRWRATAWWAFLEASAKKRGSGNPGGETSDELIEAFFEAQERGCVDDVQIDVDVPRTINSHIMFRRRYRGG